MRNIFSKGILFIKENPSITYSLVLVVLIPAAFFFNNYIINTSYENNIDKITQRKAVLMEDIINTLIQDKIDNKELLQTTINQITASNEDVVALSVLKNQAGQNNFQVVASNNSQLVGQVQNDNIQNMIAWNRPEGVAFLDGNDQGRFWNVTKTLSNATGEKVGLIIVAFSLKDSDAMINTTIYESYWILIITIIVVILFVSNQAKLFGYALTVTKLKEVDKMKDMFISMAGHELRSPLTAIKGYVDLLKDRKNVMDDFESKRFMDNISTSIDRLKNLIEDILEVSRIEGNKLPVEMIKLDPTPTIIQSVEEMRSQAIQKGLKLTFVPCPEEISIEADANRLKQVVVNLISNSLKYTSEGSVTVSMSIKNKNLLITVADTGIGISSENQANLFQKFYRVQNEKTSEVAGTGLGLWITAEIIKVLNGSITVESIEGVGSHFTVHFPLVKKEI